MIVCIGQRVLYYIVYPDTHIALIIFVWMLFLHLTALG